MPLLSYFLFIIAFPQLPQLCLAIFNSSSMYPLGGAHPVCSSLFAALKWKGFFR